MENLLFTVVLLALQRAGRLWVSNGELPESPHVGSEPHPVAPAPRNDALPPRLPAGGHRQLQGACLSLYRLMWNASNLRLHVVDAPLCHARPPEVPPAGAVQRGVPVHEGVKPRGHGAVLRGHQSSNQSHAQRSLAGTEGQLGIPQSEIPQRCDVAASPPCSMHNRNSPPPAFPNCPVGRTPSPFPMSHVIFWPVCSEYSRYLHSHLDVPVAEYNVDQDLPGNFKNHWAKNLPFLIEDYEEQPGLQPHIK